jgi:hypothetical protein
MQAKLPGAQHGIVVVARAFDIPPVQSYGRPRSGGEPPGRKTGYDNFEVQGKTGEKPALTRNREP